jgi:hypothetical protein
VRGDLILDPHFVGCIATTELAWLIPRNDGMSDDLIAALEDEWDLDQDFLGKLRQGIFDPVGLERLIRLLEGIDFGDSPEVNRRLVSLLWFMPLFIEWQRERVHERGGDPQALMHATGRVQDSIIRILGFP